MSPHFINRLRMAYVFVILMVRVGLVKRSPTYEACPPSYEAQPNQQAGYLLRHRRFEIGGRSPGPALERAGEIA